MRWYVSRNGETVGPVEESQLAAWVSGGMSDASVRDDAGGPWTPVSSSPFASLLRRPPQQPPPPPAGASAALAIFGVLTGLGGCAGVTAGCTQMSPNATYAGFTAMVVGFALLALGRVLEKQARR